MGVLNDRCKDVSSVCTLLHQLLECILLHDVYQVGNVVFKCERKTMTLGPVGVLLHLTSLKVPCLNEHLRPSI